jgi:anti-sigma factor RsiW
MTEQHSRSLHLLLLSGELSAAEEQAVRRHHLRCERCRTDFENLQVLLKAVSRSQQEKPSPAVLAYLREQAERAITRPQPGSIFQRIVYEFGIFQPAVALALLVVAIMIGQWRIQQHPLKPVKELLVATDSARVKGTAAASTGISAAKSYDLHSSDTSFDADLKRIRIQMNDFAGKMLIE